MTSAPFVASLVLNLLWISPSLVRNRTMSLKGVLVRISKLPASAGIRRS